MWAIILSDNGVLPNPFPAATPGEVIAVTSAQYTLRDSERTLILQTLQNAGWVIGGRNGAAAKLGVKRTTLIAKMKKHEIYRPRAASDIDQVQETGKIEDYRTAVQ
jgi:formate hydrogenlyase transcriptional activator